MSAPAGAADVAERERRVFEAVAALGRRDEGDAFRFVGTCFHVGGGVFQGARHYLAPNGLTEASQLAVRVADRVLPVERLERVDGLDLARFTVGVDLGDLAHLVESAAAVEDGTELLVVGFALDADREPRRLSGPVAGRDAIEVEPGVAFEGFYVECDAADGMSGSPAVDLRDGGFAGTLAGLNPDWGIAAFCPARRAPR